MKVHVAIALLMLHAGMAMADDRTDYNRRAAETDQAAYRQLDQNGDGRLTPDEVRHDVDFSPRFDDIDINRDGVITPDEMRRYLERRYGGPGPAIDTIKQ